jgi:hypothetical protein
MITRRATPPVPPINTKGLALPAHVPGRIISVPLDLWPEYFQLNQLEPNGMKASGVLLVRRTASPVNQAPKESK